MTIPNAKTSEIVNKNANKKSPDDVFLLTIAVLC
jgi:hypothetical protein